MPSWFELLRALVAKDFKVRYKSTALGFVWSIANPVLFGLTFYVVFENVFRGQRENYLVFLLSGMFPWQWFASTVGGSPGSFVGNAGLIKKVRFPWMLLPTAALISNLLHFLLALAVAVPLLGMKGIWPTPQSCCACRSTGSRRVSKTPSRWTVSTFS